MYYGAGYSDFSVPVECDQDNTNWLSIDLKKFRNFSVVIINLLNTVLQNPATFSLLYLLKYGRKFVSLLSVIGVGLK
jgi:hypothetical protein